MLIQIIPKLIYYTDASLSLSSSILLSTVSGCSIGKSVIGLYVLSNIKYGIKSFGIGQTLSVTEKITIYVNIRKTQNTIVF